MAYDQTKPQPGDSKSSSQPVILENFLQIYNFVGQDHEQFGSANLGKHKWITLTEQAANPDQLPVDQATLFAKESTVAAHGTGLFWQKEGTGAVAGSVIEITDYNVTGNNGYTMLPSGLKMNFGRGTIAGGSQAGAAITFEDAFTTTCYSISFGLLGTESGSHDGADWIIYAQSLANTGFTPRRIRTGYAGSTVSFSYIAIGD